MIHIITILMTIGQPFPQAVDSQVPAWRQDTARIVAVAQDSSWVRLSLRSGKDTVIAAARDARSQLTAFRAGDVAIVTLATVAGTEAVEGVEPLTYVSSVRSILTIVIIVVLVGWVGFRLVLGIQLRSLIIGADGRYSNSKIQLSLWFAAVVVTYTVALVIRVLQGGALLAGGVDIPGNLALLSGLSVLTFTGAKGITVSQIASGRLTKRKGVPSFPGDLLRDDEGNVDLGNSQMIVVTLLALATYLVQAWGFLQRIPLAHTTLPDVDTTILATFGLGHGAYLAKKYVGDAVVGANATDTGSGARTADPQPHPSMDRKEGVWPR